MKEKIFTIIDGYGFLFRAYYVLPHLITTDGVPVGGVYGFLNMILKYITHSDYLVIAFDSGKKNFRHDLYSEYKSNRVSAPEDLIPQFSIVREAVDAFGVQYEEVNGYEADDIIATLAKKYSCYSDLKVTIVTSDKDLFQLLNYDVLIFDPIKNRYIDEKYVVGKFGVSACQLLDFLSLTGDASDNIPGVPRIGPKTAAKLLDEFGSLDNILKNIDKIEQVRVRNTLVEHQKSALLSKQLVSLYEEVNICAEIEQYSIHATNMEVLLSFLKRYEFHSLIEKVEKLIFYRSSNVEQVIKYDSEELKKFLEYCRYEGKIAIYFYFESNTFNKISLSYNEKNIFFIERDDIGDGLNIINSVIQSNGILKVVHDIKKVHTVIPNISNIIDTIDDLMLMSYSLDTGKHNHSISHIVAHNLGGQEENYSSKTLIRIHNHLRCRLFQEKLFTLYERFDKPLMKVILDMEKHGILLNTKRLQELSDKFQREISVLEQYIHKLAGENFNIASPKQLSDVLFNKLGLAKKKKSKKTGDYSTDFKVLEELKASGIEIASKVLSWRHLSKLKNTYTDALVKQVDQYGRVHTNYSTTVTATGRLSSSHPNLQNIPIRGREGMSIREAFIASDGCKIVSADYSQIELRLLAHVANVSAFKKAFANMQDIHDITAKQVFGACEGNAYDQLRRKAKSINFGIIYGISAFGLSKQLDITIHEASEYIEYYFSCYPEIKDYMETVIAFARSNGYVETLFGRKCFVKDINNRIAHIRQFSERAAINAPLQGTAADMIRRAMIQIYDRLKAGKIILQIHDELLIEVEESMVEEVANLMKCVMESVMKISVPLQVDIKIGDHWGIN